MPAVNIGSRQAGRERGPNVVDVPPERERIFDAINTHFRGRVDSSPLYGTGQAGKQIADRMYERLGGDLVKLQKALGHRSILSTASYVSFREEEIEEAILAL